MKHITLLLMVVLLQGCAALSLFGNKETVGGVVAETIEQAPDPAEVDIGLKKGKAKIKWERNAPTK